MKRYRCTETVPRYFDRGSYYPELEPEEDDELVEGCILLEDNHMFRHSVSPEFLQKNFVVVTDTEIQAEENWRKGRATRIAIASAITVSLFAWWALTWRS